MEKEEGFTIPELMVVVSLMAVIVALGSVALRNYYQVRSLKEAQGMVVTQLRQVQQRSVAESHPNIYGVRFRKGTNEWSIVRYDANTATCSVVTSKTFEGGVIVASDSGTLISAAAGTVPCRNASPGASAENEVALFNPSGTATSGSLRLTSAPLARSKNLTISALTGRVTASP